MNKFVSLCERSYPVLESALSALSGSDASLFLSVTGLRKVISQRTLERYVSIYRDMPEQIGWMRTMASRDHTVILAGAGINQVFNRLKYPLTYWKRGMGESTIRLWFLVVTMEDCRKQEMETTLEDTVRYVDINGFVKSSTRFGVFKGEHLYSFVVSGDHEPCDKFLDFEVGILPTLGTWPRCNEYSDTYPPRNTRWFIDPTPNENRIQFVIGDTFGQEPWSTHMKLCPYLETEMCRSFNRTQPRPTKGLVMPYLNVRTGKLSVTQKLGNEEVHENAVMDTVGGQRLAFGIGCRRGCDRTHGPGARGMDGEGACAMLFADI